MSSPTDPDAPPPPPSSGWAPGLARSIGGAVARTRDALARLLLRLGATPDAVTIAGAVFSIAGGLCFALGAGHTPPWERALPGLSQSLWPTLGTAWLILAGAMDMLDGAIARQGRCGTRTGAFLDSTVDRVSDFAIYAGCGIHFAAAGQATLTGLCFLGVSSAFLISYVKARAESLAPGVGGGYWQRGERYCFLCLGGLIGHLPAALWLMALAPWLTVAHRVRASFAALGGRPLDESRAAFRRGTRAYDALCIASGIFIVAAPWLHPLLRGIGDPLGDWLRAASGG